MGFWCHADSILFKCVWYVCFGQFIGPSFSPKLYFCMVCSIIKYCHQSFQPVYLDVLLVMTWCFLHLYGIIWNFLFCSHVFCRLVSERRVPYMDIQEAFPEEMRLFGKDVHIFQVWVRMTQPVHTSSVMNQCVVFLIAMTTSTLLQHLPSYSTVHREALNLAQIMQLPSFPTVSPDCLLHPLPLTVRYMLDANLPGECLWL